MSENASHFSFKLDPWSASSLLQKAIRRGEVGLAQRAAQTLYRFRGASIFRRLATIAVEDIGIGDIGLLQEIVRIGTNKALRSVLGSDADLLDDLCGRMAEATKDRSADYLICAATKLDTARRERAQLEKLPTADLISVATDPSVPLIRRAVATLIACTTVWNSDVIDRPKIVEQFLDAFQIKFLPLHDAVQRLADKRAHPFCLMLPLIWSRFWHDGGEFSVVRDMLPEADFVGGVPLHTFDKHTALGKAAIATFSRENRQVAAVLEEWVPDASRRSSVAEIAAFYCDASPVKNRLDWTSGRVLQFIGLRADMLSVGCDIEGIDPILAAARDNLPHLNELRRKLASRGQCNRT
jgi:hypothetical protein